MERLSPARKGMEEAGECCVLSWGLLLLISSYKELLLFRSFVFVTLARQLSVDWRRLSFFSNLNF